MLYYFSDTEMEDDEPSGLLWLIREVSLSPCCHLTAALPPLLSPLHQIVCLASHVWLWLRRFGLFFSSHVIPAFVPKVINGMADEICCPEAPKVTEKMALWIQRANLTERYSVGGDWLARGCLAHNSCKFNEHPGSWEFELPACNEKVRCTNQLTAGTLPA